MALKYLRPRLSAPWCNVDPDASRDTTPIDLECHFSDSSVNQRISVCKNHLRMLVHSDPLTIKVTHSECRYYSNYFATQHLLSVRCSIPSIHDATVYIHDHPLRLINLSPLPNPDCPSSELIPHLEITSFGHCQIRSQPSPLPTSFMPPGTYQNNQNEQDAFQHLDLALCRSTLQTVNLPPLEDRVYQISILVYPKHSLNKRQVPDFLPKDQITPSEIESLRRPLLIPRTSFQPSNFPWILDPLNQPATRPTSAQETHELNRLTPFLDPQSSAPTCSGAHHESGFPTQPLPKVSFHTDALSPPPHKAAWTSPPPPVSASHSCHSGSDLISHLSLEKRDSPPPSYSADQLLQQQLVRQSHPTKAQL